MTLVVAAAATILSLPATPALAFTPSCSGSSCNGVWPGESNCGSDPAAFAVATINVADFARMRFDALWYSPACHTYWGEDPSGAAGYARTLQLWSQDQYGGRQKALFAGSFVPVIIDEDKEINSSSDTRMYYLGGNESIKFCYIWTGQVNDPAVPNGPIVTNDPDVFSPIAGHGDTDTNQQTDRYATAANGGVSDACTVWR
jgi:hypothetical protein